MVTAVKRNLTFFLVGKIISVFGSTIFSFAAGLYILSRTGSALTFSVTLLLNILPSILLSPVAGTLSDRWNRKVIIIVSDFGCAIWLTIIFIIFSFNHQSLWILYIAIGVLSVLNTFYSSAVTSSIYNMVGPDNLQRALSLNQAVSSFSAILGPVLGGLFFGIFPISIFLIINIVAFVFSGISSVLIQYNLFSEKKTQMEKMSMWREFTLGFVYIKKQTLVLHLIFISLWINFWFAIFEVTLPYLVLTIRGMNSTQFGIIEGTFSAGILVMSIVLTMRKEIKKKANSIVGGVIMLSIVLILLGFPDLPGLVNLSNKIIFPYLMLVVMLLAAIIMIINTPVMILIQKSTEDAYRGRVLSLLNAGASAMAPLGYLIFGALLEKMHVWFLLTICGGCILCGMLFQLRKRNFTNLLHQTDRSVNTLGD